MVKLILLFRQPPDEQAFELHYSTNLPMLEKMPGVHRRQACLVWGAPGGQSPYYRVTEFYFDDRETLDAALLSPEGIAAGKDLMSFAGRGVELVFCDVFEE